MMNNITIDLEEMHVQPLQRFTGEVTWQLDTVPKTLALRLFWHTQGRGSTDLKIVESLKLNCTLSGSEFFSFDVPAGPYSFSGTLISLMWGIEVVTDQENIFTTKDLIVSPTGAEIIL